MQFFSDILTSEQKFTFLVKEAVSQFSVVDEFSGKGIPLIWMDDMIDIDVTQIDSFRWTKELS